MNTANLNIQKKAVNELIQILDSKFFKALSEPARVQILKYLILNGRSDIADIAANLPQDRSVISRHLQLMHEVGILSCEKVTRHRYYEIEGSLFLNKLETIIEKIKACMPACCPTNNIK